MSMSAARTRDWRPSTLDARPADDARQRRLLDALIARLAPAEVIETHISHILLAGDFAWKIKKPVNPGFLDFTTLAARRQFCREEMRLNGRLAPDIYLGVVAFCGLPETPVVVDDPADERSDVFEYAVKMLRFPQECLADRMLAEGRLQPEHMDELARVLAEFHGRIPRAAPEGGHGTPGRILAPVRRVFDILGRTILDGEGQECLARLDNWSEMSFSALISLMERRRDQGFIRECHGDLHLGNIAVLAAGVRIFDGIEFDPELRWIDIQSEAAFLVMDCASRGRSDLGERFLDGWLSISGDYEGLALLRWYAVYRALVRSMVASLRAGQSGLSPEVAGEARRDALAHLCLADRLAHPPRPMLILTHGPSGSGKTIVSQALVESLPAVRLRSDVERKRRFGLAPLDRGGPPCLYGAEVTEATYGDLAQLARQVLAAGHHALVDATFLQRRQRDRFCALAKEMGVPCLILDCQASPDVLRRRVAARSAADRDASDATLAVLAAQLASIEPLAGDETAITVETERETPPDLLAKVRAALVA